MEVWRGKRWPIISFWPDLLDSEGLGAFCFFLGCFSWDPIVLPCRSGAPQASFLLFPPQVLKNKKASHPARNVPWTDCSSLRSKASPLRVPKCIHGNTGPSYPKGSVRVAGPKYSTLSLSLSLSIYIYICIYIYTHTYTYHAYWFLPWIPLFPLTAWHRDTACASQPFLM